MAKIKLKIVTPERIAYEDEIDQATIPTTDGEITILPNHISLASIIKPGEFLIKKDGQEIFMAVSGGIIKFDNNELTILADSAERAEEIDEAKVEEARLRAVASMAEVTHKDSVEYNQLLGNIERELVRLKVARKRRHHQTTDKL